MQVNRQTTAKNPRIKEVEPHLQALGEAMWSRGGNRPAPNPLRRLLQAALAFLVHLNRFVEHPFPLCRKPEELLASCYTQHFTFWNGSGDPGQPTEAYESFFIQTMPHQKPVILLCSSIRGALKIHFRKKLGIWPNQRDPLPVSWAAKKRKKSLMFILHFRLS